MHLWDNDCNTPTLLAIQVGGAGQGGEVGRAERGGVGRWEGRDEEVGGEEWGGGKGGEGGGGGRSGEVGREG